MERERKKLSEGKRICNLIRRNEAETRKLSFSNQNPGK